MYKLTVIAGPNRGTSYALQDGEVSIGRQTGNTVVLSSSKISKRHCVLIVNQREVVIKDQGSSNGTFVNGILTKLRKIKPGDRISVGEYVLELVEPQKKVTQAAPALAGLGNVIQLPGMGSPFPIQGTSQTGSASSGVAGMGNSINSAQQAPKDLVGKILWNFENHVMPIFYALNLKHEWRVLSLGMVAAFVVGNLLFSVYPLMESSRVTVVKETGRRAQFMARQVAEHNAPYLAARAETKTEIGIVENAEGVRLALLSDLENRIIAPSSKMNQYLANGSEAIAAVKAREAFRSGRESGFWIEADDKVIAIEPVKVLNPAAGKNVVVAMAIVSIDTTLTTPDVGEMGMVYAETLILTGLLGGLIFFILYRVTLKPFQVLNEDMDKALKGDISRVSHDFRLEELDPLWEIINSAIQRIPKDGASGSGMDGMLADPSLVLEEFLGPLKAIGNIVKFGFVIFDSDKKIAFLNSSFEEMSGIRADAAVGQGMSDVARDQAMGAFTTDILDRAPAGGEGVSEDFEVSGITYKMFAAGFGRPGQSAKCYILAALRAEG